MNQTSIWDNKYAILSSDFEDTQWIEQYIAYCNEKKSKKIIDLGCGRGPVSEYLSKSGFDVLACDFSSVAIQYINETFPLIKTRCFNMIDEFPKDITDAGVVIASLSTHYFSHHQTAKLYQNIHTMLEPEGYFIFRVNSKQEFENKDKFHLKEVIEEDYYTLNDGSMKRYFDIDSVSALIRGFSLVTLNENTSIYDGKEKYFIEGVARKK